MDELTSNKYVLLIDGFDEIRERNSKVLFESEVIPLSRIGKLKIILTSREANYHGELPRFIKYKINELTNMQIDEYAQKNHSNQSLFLEVI